MVYNLIGWQKVPDKHQTYMLMEQKPNLIERLFFMRTGRVLVRGDCTCWSYYPCGTSCGTFMEGSMYDLSKMIEFNKIPETKDLVE